MGKKEAKVEDYLVAGVAELGGVAEKFTVPGRKGPPDRLVQWPEGLLSMMPEIDFVECKSPDANENTPHFRRQQRDHAKRRAMGFRVYVLDSTQKVDIYLDKRRRMIMANA